MAADILQSHGDGCYSSKIGQASNLEDEFASKASLLSGGGCENFRPTAEDSIEEDSEDSMEEDYDDLTVDLYSPEDSDGDQVETFTRSVIKEGQEVELPANLWYICLKHGPPEGCSPVKYHLNFLKQVVGSDADEVYIDAFSETVLTAVLTDEEHEKLNGMEQVESSCITRCTYSLD